MFTDGLQDWIGLSETDLFGGRHKPEGLNGHCRVAASIQCDNGAPAARVFGQASKHGQSIPKTLVIVDSTGVVHGVARSSVSVCPFINRMLYTGSRSATEVCSAQCGQRSSFCGEDSREASSYPACQSMSNTMLFPHIPPPVYVPNNASALWGEFALRPGGYFVANIFDTGPCFVPTSHA